MGQTLTHGIYLPDEGERNCYNGLAGNWSILDGAVGTVAEHTSQIAGKAPAVHTHGKADITDLFNSANTWSGENKYTSGFILSNISWSGVTPPSSTKPTVIEFKNSDTRQGRYINRISSTSSETWIETIRNVDANTSYNHTVVFQVDNSGNKRVYPYSNNDIDLGIAAYQWNNLYAKNYYYNGTAWGLDKENEWTGPNTFSDAANCVLSFKFGTSGLYNDIRYYDSNNSNYACLRSKVTDLTLGVKYSSKSAWYDGASVVIRNDGNVQIKSYGGAETWTTNFAPIGVYPTSDKVLELGTSSHKWKTLNGVNPGALSLPSGSYVEIDTTNWDKTGATSQSYTPVVHGWLYISIQNIAGNYLSMSGGKGAVSMDGTGVQSGLRAMLPAIANESISITVKTGSIFVARFYPCQGNV